MIMFGGSPLIVAAPPQLAAKSSAMMTGTGSNLSKRASSMVTMHLTTSATSRAATVRWRCLRLVTGDQTLPVPLSVTLPDPDRTPPPVLPNLRMAIQQALIEISTSEVKMKAYGFNREVVLQRATDAISHAVDHDMRVIFFPVDSTRSDLGFLQEVYGRTIEAGASEVAVVDTIGACAPEAVESLIRTVRGWIGPDIHA